MDVKELLKDPQAQAWCQSLIRRYQLEHGAFNALFDKYPLL